MIYRFLAPFIMFMLFTQRTSHAGINEIKKLEGFSAVPYRDSANYPTIGYGHKIKSNEYFERITEQQATQILKQDLSIAEKTIRNDVVVPLSRNQFDALVLFVFNVGVNAFKDSTLLKLLNEGDYIGAARQFGQWVYITIDGRKEISEGLIVRRDREYNLFIAG
jgi:lysozyme